MPSETTQSPGASRKRMKLLLSVLATLAIALILAQAQTPTVLLQADTPGLAIMGNRFMISLPISNNGAATATSVQVTAATLATQQLIAPASFPAALGTMAPSDTANFQSDFNATGLAQDTPYVLTVSGTYRANSVTSNFTLTSSVSLPLASPGYAIAGSTTVASQSVSGALFLASRPAFGAGVNEPPPPTPIGPIVVAGTPSPQSTSAPSSKPEAVICYGCPPPPPPPPPAPGLTFVSNYGVGPVRQTANNVAEPSGASGGGVVFVSFNNGAAYSTDGGSTFHALDPTTIFPNTPYGFCCDQWVQYVPSINRFMWLQQIVGANVDPSVAGGPGAYRLAAASPAQIKSSQGRDWTYWTLTPEILGQIHAQQFDYPSMSAGNNYLYVSWDTDCPPNDAPCNTGRQVIRIPLSQIPLGGSLTVQYTSPLVSGLAWAAFLAQNPGDGIFWPAHNGTNQLRVFSWPESSNVYSWQDIGIASYIPNNDACVTPSGTLCASPGHVPSLAPIPVSSQTPVTRDWLSRGADDGISGAARSGNQLWFAWNAAPNPSLSIPLPYVNLVALDISPSLAINQQLQIWNEGNAFALPSLSTNACTGEIGISMASGGGNNYPQHVVGFIGTFGLYTTTTGNVTTGIYGDYVTIRQNNTPSLNGAFFDVFGYALNKVSAKDRGTILPPSEVNVDVRYVVFGRAGACGQ
jgi:hypothetical protein